MKTLFTLPLLLFIFISCSESNVNAQIDRNFTAHENSESQNDNLQKAYFASGCFWCVEAIYESVEGVHEAVSGYSGGITDEPTYRQVGTGVTGHSETVEVIYDPSVVDFKTLVTVYYGSQDPTTVNGQHPDYGSAYRSIIFYTNETEKKIAMEYKEMLQNSGEYDKPIATEILAFEKFWKAEEYHQNYERLNPEQSYVKNVSIPRLKKFQAKHPELLKKAQH